MTHRALHLSSTFRAAVRAAGAVLPFLGLPVATRAQDVEGTASVRGAVMDEGNRPLVGATIELGEGARERLAVRTIVTGDDGRFAIERLVAGRPFRLAVRAIGFREAVRDLPSLEPGRILQLEIHLVRTPGSLPRVTVVSEVVRQEGVGYALPGDALRNLPLFNKSLAGLVRLIPQALGRGLPSFGAQNPRFNAVRIDGTTGSDVFGFGLTPGSEGGAPPLSLEALAGVRVMLSPMDVRYGGFTGGAIDLETRSGTDRRALSVMTAYQQDGLIGRFAGTRAPALDYKQVAITAEGPVVRSRLHYLVTAEVVRRDSAYQLSPGSNVPEVSPALAERARVAVQRRFGFDPGGHEAPITRQPNRSLFAKLSWSADRRHAADVSYHGIRASTDGFDRSSVDRGIGWMLSRSGYRVTSRIDALRTHARSTFGRLRSEAFASLQSSRDLRDSRLEVPLFVVRYSLPPASDAYLGAGSFRNAQGTVLDQHQAELGNDLTFSSGNHELTLGARLERFSFVDNVLLLRWGAWAFDNVDSLESGSPSRYDIGLPVPGSEGPVARFAARTLAAYLQERWNPHPRVHLTAGVRLESMWSDAPRTNPLLLGGRSTLGIDTGELPASTRLLPRIGATVALDGSGRTHLRVGVGRFAARPPYVWISNAVSSTGLEQRALSCVPATGVPAPVVDLAALPSSCTRSTEFSNSSPIVSFAPGTRFPLEDKLFVGIDHGFGGGWTASLDLLAGVTRSSVMVLDRNLVVTGSDAEGRTLYGAFGAAGGVPSRLDKGVPPAYTYRNYRGGDEALSASLLLTRRWSDRRFVQAGYQWMRATDRMVPNGRAANASYAQVPIDGSAGDRRITRSSFDIPHSFTALLASPLGGWVDASVTVRAQSGRPFSWTVNGDVNADSVAGNDLAWIPRDSTEMLLSPMEWRALDAFIAGDRCLAKQRGRLVGRNSCRNPSVGAVDLRLSRRWSGRLGTWELGIEVFNLANFIDHSRGLVREITARETAPLIGVRGWDATRRRPIYAMRRSPPRATVIPDLSRWKVQVGARYRP